MLIIYAHPNKLGHCGYMLEQTQKTLDKKNIDYKILDLYKMRYDPVLKSEEHYTSGHKIVSDDIKKIQNSISRHNKFIIIYPNWWNSTPAILKGFFDRVLTSNFAFKYVNQKPVGLLKGKVIVLSSSGGSSIYERLIAKNRSLKAVTKDTLNFCGLKSKGYSIGSATRLTEKQKNIIKKKVKSALKFLE